MLSGAQNWVYSTGLFNIAILVLCAEWIRKQSRSQVLSMSEILQENLGNLIRGKEDIPNIEKFKIVYKSHIQRPSHSGRTRNMFWIKIQCCQQMNSPKFYKESKLFRFNSSKVRFQLGYHIFVYLTLLTRQLAVQLSQEFTEAYTARTTG